jgi:hypothetical protein
MTNEMTPREHEDMRDLVLAGAQRIRPVGSHRRLASVGVSVIVVAAITGGVAGLVNGRVAPDEVPAVAPTDSSSELWPAPDPPACEPSPFPGASLPGIALPAPGERVTLEEDPCLTVKSLLGTIPWLDSQGIDAARIQGYERVAGIEPWTAPLADGSGSCILIRGRDRNGWGPIACDSTSAPASVEQTTDGSVLRFVIENGAIAVYAISP